MILSQKSNREKIKFWIILNSFTTPNNSNIEAKLILPILVFTD